MSDTQVTWVHYVWGIAAMAVGASIVFRLSQRESFREEVNRAGLHIKINKLLDKDAPYSECVAKDSWSRIVDFINRKVDREYPVGQYSEDYRAQVRADVLD